MPISKTTHKWLAIAHADLRDATALLEYEDRFLRLIVFAAQQSAEKSIKSFLTHQKCRFPNTHDIENLLKIVEQKNPELAKNLHEANYLTAYAIAFRYPDAATEELNHVLALKAVGIAERTMKLILEILVKT